MDMLQVFLFGMMVAWTPSAIFFAWLIWRAPIEISGEQDRSYPLGDPGS